MRLRYQFVLIAAVLLLSFLSVGSLVAQQGTPDHQEISVIDALGREVNFDNLPTRIVAPGKASWMLAHALYLFPEADERVLAMEKRQGEASEFLASLYPGFARKPHVEMNAAPEQIAPLKPDVVVLKSYMRERLGNSLEMLGFPVVYVDLETPDQFIRDITTLGQLLGNGARAEEIKTFYQARLDLLRQRLEGALDGSETPDVLVIQNTGRAQEIAFQIPPSGWMQTIEMELAGGNPVWKEMANNSGWNIVNFEQIAAWNPDEIFVIVFRDEPTPVMEMLKDDSKWRVLQAVKSEKIYAFPADFFGWDVPDPRWILGAMWAATKIHPDLFPDVDMTQEVYHFFDEMYGMDRSSTDKEIISRLTGDIVRPAPDMTQPLSKE